MNILKNTKIILSNHLSLAIFGFIFFAIACYPGFMSPDSLEQYQQAQTMKFADAHPPVMAWVWSRINFILDGPQNLLFLHLGMLWAGLYIFQKNTDKKLSLAWYLIVGALPWVANFEGVLWKDVGMAYSLLLAFSMLNKTKINKYEWALIFIFVLYAFMIRTNAPAAIIPLIWYACGRLLPQLSNKIKGILTVISLLLMFIFMNFFTYSLLKSEKNHIVTFMMVDDLVHLSIVENKSLLPNVDFKTLKECSDEVIGDTKLVGRLFCLITKSSYKQVSPIPYDDVRQAWFSAIYNNPLESLKFRLQAYSYFLRSPFQDPYIYWFSGISENNMGLKQVNNLATNTLANYVKGVAHFAPFLFKPYWWLILNLLLICSTFFIKGDQNSLSILRSLLLSALLYMLGYIPLAPMADFRYVYWSTLAISLAGIKFFTSNLHIDWFSRNSLISRFSIYK